MTSTLRPVLALCLAICFSYSSAQEVTSTGNLIDNSNWSGATYGVDPGGCCASVSGSGALYDTSTNTIMFSYGTDTLTQTIGLQQALGGTGIQVHGYSVSFDYRLIGKSNGTVSSDELYVLTRITDSAGNSTQLDYWNLSGTVLSGVNDVWATVGTTRSFLTPYLDPQSITFEMNGRDGGFWAGYYGPEVRNVSLSVNYSFDPCASDPLYSTSCAGYWEAFQDRYGAAFTSPEPVVSSPVTTTDTANTGSDVMPVTTPVASPGTNIDVSDSQPVTATVQATTTADSRDSERSAPANLSSILNNIRGIEAELAGIAQRTVEQSISDSTTAGEQSAQQSLTEAESSAEAAQESAQDGSASGGLNAPHSAGTGVTAVTGDAQFSVPGLPGSSVDITAILNLAPSRVAPVSVDPAVSAPNVGTPDAAGAVLNITSYSEFGPEATDNNNVVSLGTDPVAAARDNSARPLDMSPDSSATETSAGAPTPGSALAGGVDAAELTKTAPDFTAYLDRSLQDTRFYQEREIYPGQQTVDNRRAQRLLSGSSDRLHQSMVDQQYRRQ